jgi:hypothetical protein
MHAGLHESLRRGAQGMRSAGGSGEIERARSVICAAMRKDRDEGRPVDPNITVYRALARLREGRYP